MMLMRRQTTGQLGRPSVARMLSSKGTVRDEWGDEAFAREWTLGGGADRTNPDRQRFQAMLGSLVKKRLTSEFGTGSGVLDLGCGSGLSAQAIVDATGGVDRLVGIDGSEAMLGLTGTVCPSMTTTQVRFGDPLSAAATDLLYGSGPFRAVTCSQVLHELPPPAKDAAVALARSVLAPNGCFYVTDRFIAEVTPGVPADDAEAIWQVLIKDQPDAKRWPDYAKYIQAKLDDATTEAQCVALLQKHFDHVDVLYRVFNRSLIVARVASAS